MSVEFSPVDISIIENMMLTKTHKQIAEMIDKPLKETGELIETICEKEELMSCQAKQTALRVIRRSERPVKVKPPKRQKDDNRTPWSLLDGDRPAAVEKKPVTRQARASKEETPEQKLAREIKEERKAADLQRRNHNEVNRRDRENRRQPAFKNKEVDYNELRTLRIDKRTVIYIKYGEDPKKAKENFLKVYAKVIPHD